MSIISRFSIFSSIFLLSVLISSSAWAKLPDGVKTYRLALSDEQAEKKTSDSVDAATEEMNFIKRPFARAALKKYALPLVHTILAGKKGDTVSVKIGTQDQLTSKNKATQDALLDGKEKMRVTITFDEHSIFQRNVTDRGIKAFKLVFSADGKRMNVTFIIESSDDLPQPIKVTLPYKLVSK